jgi:hypothetical protein
LVGVGATKNDDNPLTVRGSISACGEPRQRGCSTVLDDYPVLLPQGSARRDDVLILDEDRLDLRACRD